MRGIRHAIDTGPELPKISCLSCNREIAARQVTAEKRSKGCHFYACRECDLFYKLLAPDGRTVLKDNTADIEAGRYNRPVDTPARCQCGELAIRRSRPDFDGEYLACPSGRCSFVKIEHGTDLKELQLRTILRKNSSNITQDDLLASLQTDEELRRRIATYSQGSELWHRWHLFRVGASRVSTIAGHGGFTTVPQLLQDLIFGGRRISSFAMRFGTTFEDYVRRCYETWKYGTLLGEGVAPAFGVRPADMIHNRLLASETRDTYETQRSSLASLLQELASQADGAERKRPRQEPTEEPTDLPVDCGSLVDPQLQIAQTGFHLLPELDFLGASPDGLVHHRDANGKLITTILEIKTRQPRMPLDYSDNPPERYPDCPAPAGVPAYYYDQMITNAAIQQAWGLNIDGMDFVVCNVTGGMRITSIPFNETARNYWRDNLLPKVRSFHERLFLPCLLRAVQGTLTPDQLRTLAEEWVDYRNRPAGLA